MSVNDRFEAYLRSVVNGLISRPDAWAGLVDVRPKLDLRGLSRAMQDEHLRRLSLAGVIMLAPESNRKVLTQVDHEASIRVGGEDNHLIMFLK